VIIRAGRVVFSADETPDIGYEPGTPVSLDYIAHGSKPTGKAKRVQLDAGADDNDHFIDPAERRRGSRAWTTKRTRLPGLANLDPGLRNRGTAMGPADQAAD
jgi:hypothetical protein